MYKNTNKEYEEAIEYAQLNGGTNPNQVSVKLVMINLMLLGLVSFLGFNYLSKENNSSLLSKKEAVLGVSYHSTDNGEYSDKDLVEILSKVEIDEVVNSSKESNMESKMTVLDDKNGIRGRIVVVKQNDTLSDNKIIIPN